MDEYTTVSCSSCTQSTYLASRRSEAGTWFCPSCGASNVVSLEKQPALATIGANGLSSTTQGPATVAAPTLPRPQSAPTPPTTPPAPKRKRGKQFALIGAGVFALIIIVSALGSGVQPTQRSSDTTADADAVPPASSAEVPEAAPAAPVAKTIAPISLSGSGKSVKKVSLQEGVAVFRMTHKGSANFAPQLMDASSGELVDLLANRIGSFKGSKIVGVTGGRYLLEIEASGPWTIKIEQPRPTSAPSAPRAFKGTGASVGGPVRLNAGAATFTMSHRGGSNFAVMLLDYNGELVDLLANEIGNFKGEAAAMVLEDGIYWISIEADGVWSVSVE